MRKWTWVFWASILTFNTTPVFSQPIFAPPQNLGPKINSPYYEADPFLTADGKKLFFVSARPGGYGQEDIWYSEMTDTGWTNAVILGPQINSFRREQSPSVSPDGQKLYYVDAERDGYLWDIWVSTWNPSTNDWGIPQNIGAPVNTPGVEYSAHIDPSGQRLYFTSVNGPDSLFPIGRCGIYVSEWNGSGWSVPVEVVPNLETCSGTQYPSITADGSWLFYDQYVSDGTSIFVTPWIGSSWGSAIDLRSQIGGRSGTPSATAVGDKLYFSSLDIGGFGSRDIWVMQQVFAQNVPALKEELWVLLAFGLIFIAILALKKHNREPLQKGG